MEFLIKLNKKNIGVTGLGEPKEGDCLIMMMHNAVNAAARKTFPTKPPFRFESA